MTAFDRAFTHVIGVEGGLSLDPNDPGNWTQGMIGKGELRGTKFGISAAAYPTLDIKSLSLDDARAIYVRDYWKKIRADELPAELAFCMFDAAVNQGPASAVRCLQQTLDITVDGVIGPATLAAARRRNTRELVEWFQAERVLRYAQLSDFKRYGRGWTRRAIATAMQAISD